MTNIAHAVLSGSDLHEPKGIGSAAINTAYIANGVGSGSWSQIPAAALSPGANAFGGGLMHVREQQASGVAGSSNVGTGWKQRTLNTVVTNDTGVPILSGNQVTLPAGTYFAQARAVIGFTVTSFTCTFQLKLFNFTATADLVFGVSNQVFGGNNQGNLHSDLFGRFTLLAPSIVELRGWGNNATNGGFATATGTSEVYADLLLWKTA